MPVISHFEGHDIRVALIGVNSVDSVHLFIFICMNLESTDS